MRMKNSICTERSLRDVAIKTNMHRERDGSGDDLFRAEKLGLVPSG